MLPIKKKILFAAFKDQNKRHSSLLALVRQQTKAYLKERERDKKGSQG